MMLACEYFLVLYSCLQLALHFYEAALANLEVAMQEWIETAKEVGRPIPEPRVIRPLRSKG
jgi:hypothetical protein